jgi:polyphosphate kinase 2 (PPK2 family)
MNQKLHLSSPIQIKNVSLTNLYTMTLNELQVNSSRRFKLSDWNPSDTMGKSKQDCEELSTLHSLMSELQYRLYIESKKSLLIILQGMDTSGKDGTIRQVLGAFNPAGCYVKAFKVPTEEELSHDFFVANLSSCSTERLHWRIQSLTI